MKSPFVWEGNAAKCLAPGGVLQFNGTPLVAGATFGTIACPSGTNPVASGTADTLTLQSSTGDLIIEGNSATDTINFKAGPNLKTRFFDPDYSANLGAYRVRSVGAGTSARLLTGRIPSNFTSMVNAYIVIVPSAGAAGAARDIDFIVERALAGQAYNFDSQSDTTTTYDLTGLANIVTLINIASLFSTAVANQYFGVQVTQGATGGAINYLGMYMVYN